MLTTSHRKSSFCFPKGNIYWIKGDSYSFLVLPRSSGWSFGCDTTIPHLWSPRWPSPTTTYLGTWIWVRCQRERKSVVKPRRIGTLMVWICPFLWKRFPQKQPDTSLGLRKLKTWSAFMKVRLWNFTFQIWFWFPQYLFTEMYLTNSTFWEKHMCWNSVLLVGCCSRQSVLGGKPYLFHVQPLLFLDVLFPEIIWGFTLLRLLRRYFNPLEIWLTTAPKWKWMFLCYHWRLRKCKHCMINLRKHDFKTQWIVNCNSLSTNGDRPHVHPCTASGWHRDSIATVGGTNALEWLLWGGAGWGAGIPSKE